MLGNNSPVRIGQAQNNNHERQIGTETVKFYKTSIPPQLSGLQSRPKRNPTNKRLSGLWRNTAPNHPRCTHPSGEELSSGVRGQYAVVLLHNSHAA